MNYLNFSRFFTIIFYVLKGSMICLLNNKTNFMKNNLKITFIICFLLFGCKRDEAKSSHTSQANHPVTYGDGAGIPPVGGGGGGGGGGTDPNYCEGCGSSTVETDCCSAEVGGGETCADCVCGSIMINDMATYYHAGDQIDLTVAYMMRDSFLINFLKGQQYISYYGYISQVMINNSSINAGNVVAHLSFLSDISAASHTLMYGAPTAVPFSSGLLSDALAMTAYYRLVDTSVFFDGILDTIDADMIAVTGLTNAQIYALY